jgi:hypothetical protein
MFTLSNFDEMCCRKDLLRVAVLCHNHQSYRIGPESAKSAGQWDCERPRPRLPNRTSPLGQAQD